MSKLAKYDDQEVLIQFDENAFEPAVSPYDEDFDDQVQEAQEQLLQLRHKQEQLERQKAELEELNQKKDTFVTGRTKMTEKLSRAVVTLEREAIQAQKRADQYLEAKDQFEHHIRVIQSLRPELWSRQELRSELSRALAAIEDAESEYEKSGSLLALIKADTEKSAHGPAKPLAGPSAQVDFLYWLKCGLAFTLPLLVFGIITMIVVMFFTGGAGN